MWGLPKGAGIPFERLYLNLNKGIHRLSAVGTGPALRQVFKSGAGLYIVLRVAFIVTLASADSRYTVDRAAVSRGRISITSPTMP